jgi:anti-sigma regulatory factor (Ser/Thr protein kinase)
MSGNSQMRAGQVTQQPAAGRYRHEAFLYSGLAEFLAGTVSFLRPAIEAGDPALVVVSRQKIELLRQELGAGASRVSFADMTEIGANPARIIPAWRAFVQANDGAAQLYGIGEPVYPGRSPMELAECQLHEALLNVAFASATPFWLLCPYDLAALASDVIEQVQHSHPVIARVEAREASSTFRHLDEASPFHRPLPARPPDVAGMVFRPGELALVRTYVARRAEQAGLAQRRASDLVLAVNEIATNSLRHGGGQGELRVWAENGTLICEISDRGHVTAALAGRLAPALGTQDGGGLWLANHLCDLMQIFSAPDGTTIRLYQAADQG